MTNKMLSIAMMTTFIIFLIGMPSVMAGTYGNLTYSVENSEVTITKCSTSAQGNIVIPDTIEGYPVTKIGNSAFIRCEKITGITIPDSVKSIGSSAFYNCTKLVNIDIPDGITSIGADAFRYSGYYNNNWSGDEMYVGKYLVDVSYSISGTCYVNSGTLLIADEALYNLPNLTGVDIPDSVTNIGSNAFAHCENLSDIWIGEGVKNISENAFQFDSNITRITVDSKNPYFSVVDGNLYSKDKTVLVRYASGKTISEFTIPSTVKKISGYAFSGSANITSITISNSVTSIGVSAFGLCDNLVKVNITDLKAWCNIDFEDYQSNPIYYSKKLYLNGNLITNLTIPSSVTSIKYQAFMDCESITAITISDTVKTIEDRAFCYCKNLSRIDFGKGVTSIGEDAFLYCESLTNITIPNSVTSIGTEAFGMCDGLISVTIPSSVTKIGGNLFNSCDSLTNVNLPSSLSKIPAGIFRYCYNLKNITIPSSVTEIQGNAFEGAGIESITIPNSVVSVFGGAFIDCTSLETIVIGENVKTLGESTFSGCVNVKTIQWNAKNLVLDLDEYDDNYVFDAVGNDGGGITLTFGSNVETIPINAFRPEDDYPYIKKVILNDKIKSVPYLGGSVSELTLGKSVESVYSQSCQKLFISDLKRYISFNGYGLSPKEVYVNGVLLTKIDIESGSTTVPKLLMTSAITEVNIPDSVTNINAADFKNCINLKTVNVSTNNPYYSSENGIVFNKNKTEIVLFPQGKQDTYYTIPSTVTSIANYAFYNALNIKEITIPENVTKIGDYAFYYTTALEKIRWNAVDIATCSASAFQNAGKNSGGINLVFGDNVKKIPDKSFYTAISSSSTAPNIISVRFGNKIESIGNSAFYMCQKIKDVYVNNLSVWCNIEFNGWSANPLAYGATLHVNGSPVSEIDIPYGTTQIKDYAFGYYSNANNTINSLMLPDTVTSIGSYAFKGCNGITKIYFNGTEEKYKSITINSNNDIFTKAEKMFYADVKIYDTKDTLLSDKKQNMGELVDLSFLNLQPGYNADLYLDQNLTMPYPNELPISKNLALYVDVYHPLLNKMKISGYDMANVGQIDVNYKATFASDKDVNALYCFIKYPDTLNLKSVVTKDFAYAGLEDEYTEDSFTTAVILAQYSETELIPKNAIHTPFELTFDISKSAQPGTIQIEATEESCLIGNETYFFEERIPGTLEILPKLAESIEISGTDVISAETTYNAIVSPDYTTDKSVEWSVDDETIATVDVNGVVTPVTSGTFILTATAKDGSGVTASKTITVTQGVTSIEISGTDSITESTTYSVIITPNYATNKEVEWSISNSEIAIVDQNGLVTPITSGIVTITATAKDGSGISASKEINIIKLAESIVITGEDIISSPAQYTATVLPDYTSDKEVSWSVDNERIATVDENGIVTPVTSGTVILTATTKDGSGVSNNKIIEIVKLAESIEIVGSEEISEPSQYSVVILPEYTTNKEAEWTVSDETIATVDKNGLVTPLKNGKIVLTAKALDASGIETTKSIVITVSIRANSITSDVGIWDKEFDSDITEYTINVPSGTTAIYLTSSFENATAKVNGSVALNGVRKKVTLTGAETDIELVLTPTSGNNLSTNTYKITVVCGSFTKTTVSEDGKSFTVVPVNIENGKTVILALYDGETFVEMQSAVYTGEEILFTTTKTYTNAKVMVWNDLVTLKPICNVEIVK